MSCTHASDNMCTLVSCNPQFFQATPHSTHVILKVVSLLKSQYGYFPRTSTDSDNRPEHPSTHTHAPKYTHAMTRCDGYKHSHSTGSRNKHSWWWVCKRGKSFSRRIGRPNMLVCKGRNNKCRTAVGEAGFGVAWFDKSVSAAAPMGTDDLLALFK